MSKKPLNRPDTAASLAAANFWFSASNTVLVIGCVLVAAGTYGAIRAGSVKERLTDERISTDERKTAEANARASQAEQRAAEANEKAEAERLARVKIEERLAPRRLSQEAADKLRAVMSEFPGTEISVLVSGQGHEAATFAAQIAETLKAAGWNASAFPWTGAALNPGTVLMVKDPSDAGRVVPANALSKELTALGFATPLKVWAGTFGGWEQFPGLLPIAFKAGSPAMRLIVADKP